jgi:TP901 family phage tail tape measure protein
MAGRFNIEAVFKAVDKFSKPLVRMTAGVDRLAQRLEKGLGAQSQIVDRVANGFVAAGTAAVGMGAVAGAALFHVAKTGADFEQAITNVGAVMGKNRGQIADLEKEAMRLGVVTQFSSSEVADGMEMMARKGFDAQEILQGIPGVLNAVAASGEGMAEVTTIVGSTIRGFGLDAANASHVADVLAFSAEKTGATITDLGGALATAAPTAKALGVSLEDTTAAVGLMQKMGIDASTSGSAVATMLAKISKPSHEAAQEMTNLGIKFQDAKGNMLPFRDVLGQFVKAGDKTGGNMKRMAFFAELVGLRGDKAALALSDMAKSGDFDKLVDGLKNVDGYAGKVAAIRMDTTKGSWKLLTSTVEVLETKLFNLESGAIKGVIDQTNAWVSANQDLIVQKVQDTIATISDKLPEIERWTKRIAEGFGGLLLWAIGIKIAEGAVTALDIATGVAKTTLKAFTKATGLASDAVNSETAAAVASTIAGWARGAALWAQNAAIKIGTAATTKFTAATITGTISSWASSVATWARTTATSAYNAVVRISTTLVAAWRTGTLLATASEWAQTVATTAKNMALRAGNVLLGIAAIANGDFAASALGAAAANGSMAASFAPFMVTVAAATAAIGALCAAWHQWKALNAETEGLGITGLASEMIKRGTFDPAKALDAYQNETARTRAEASDAGADAASAPVIIPPNASGRSGGSSEVSGSIEIYNHTDQPVTAKSRGGVSMPVVRPSGGFGRGQRPAAP